MVHIIRLYKVMMHHTHSSFNDKTTTLKVLVKIKTGTDPSSMSSPNSKHCRVVNSLG